MKLNKDILYANGIIYLVAFLGIGLFDMTLELGKFSGLVFFLYMAYFGVLALIINLILAVISYFKNPANWPSYTTAGVLMALLGVLPGWVASLLG